MEKITSLFGELKGMELLSFLATLLSPIIAVLVAIYVQNKKEKRRDLVTTLRAAKRLQMIYPENFAQRLNNPADLPSREMEAIETLLVLTDFVVCG